MKSLLVVLAAVLAASARAMSLPMFEPTMAPLLNSQEAEIIPDEYLVVFKPSVVQQHLAVGDMNSLISSLLVDAGIQEHDLIHTYDMGFAATMNQETLEKIRQHTDLVDFVEPNQVVYIRDMQTNPPRYVHMILLLCCLIC